MSGSATILSVSGLRVMMDPQTHETTRATEYWIQCGRAAMAALRSCCNLTPEEISSLRRDRWMPGGRAVVAIRDTFTPRDRDVPVIEAAYVVVARYIEETPEEFKKSRYLFITAKGRRIQRTNVMTILNRAAKRQGISENFMESAGATFANAVLADTADDGAALVLNGRSFAALGLRARPPIGRLRDCLEQHHPLRDFNRIGFFESKRQLAPLASEIRACTSPRILEDAERQLLRRQHFPGAVKLFDEGLVTQAAVGRFFGLDPKQVHKWFKRFRRKGREGLVDRNRGRLTAEWRRRTMEIYEEMSPIKSRWAFHQHLKKLHFPYGYTTLCNFLNELGEKAPRKQTMTKKWRDLVDREFAKFERPPQKKSFRLYLEQLTFPYSRIVLEKYLDATGLSPIRRGFIGGSRFKASEIRPEC